MTQGAYQGLRAGLLASRIPPRKKTQDSEILQSLFRQLRSRSRGVVTSYIRGTLVAEPQRGFRAAPISLANLVDLTLARVAIDNLCLKRAISRGYLAWEARLVAAAHRLSPTPQLVPDNPVRTNED